MGFWKLFTALTVGGSKCAFDAEYEEMSDEKLIEEFRRWIRDTQYAGPANIEAQLEMYETALDSAMSQADKRVLAIYEIYSKRHGKAAARQVLRGYRMNFL